MPDGNEPVPGVVRIGPQRHEGNRSFFNLSYPLLRAVTDDVQVRRNCVHLSPGAWRLTKRIREQAEGTNMRMQTT